jgi:hypothetical protein
MTLGGTITQLAAHDAVDGSLLDHLLDHYSLVRRLPWRGAQEARRSPADRDSEWLAQFRQCLAEADRRRKVERYEAPARLTTAPVGELRTLVATAVNPGPVHGAGPREAPPGTIGAAPVFWPSLLAAGTGAWRVRYQGRARPGRPGSVVKALARTPRPAW